MYLCDIFQSEALSQMLLAASLIARRAGFAVQRHSGMIASKRFQHLSLDSGVHFRRGAMFQRAFFSGSDPPLPKNPPKESPENDILERIKPWAGWASAIVAALGLLFKVVQYNEDNEESVTKYLTREPIQTGVSRFMQNGTALNKEIHMTFHDSNNKHGRVALVGLAGSGKSTALANYLAKYEREYAAVVLIDAGNNEKLIDSFKNVAGKLKESGKLTQSWNELLAVHETPSKVAKYLLDHIRAQYEDSSGLVLVAHENVPRNPIDHWLPVLEWTSPTAHTLLSSRTPVNILSTNSTRSIQMPHRLATDEFRELVNKQLHGCNNVKELSEDLRNRIYKLTEGLPLGVVLLIGQIDGDVLLDPDEVIAKYEDKRSDEKFNNMFKITIDNLDPQVRDALLCIAQFEPDNLPKSLMKEATAIAINGGRDSDAVHSVLSRLLEGKLLEWNDGSNNKRSNGRMHRLVHDAARARDNEAGKRSSFSRATRAIQNVCESQFQSEKYTNWLLERQLLPHLRQHLCLYTTDQSKALSPEEKRIVARNYTHLGGLLLKLESSFEAASGFYEHALKIYSADPGDSLKDIANTHISLGHLYTEMGRLDEAINNNQKALKILLDLPGVGKNHSHTAKVHNSLGYTYSEKGDKEEALKQYKKALAINLETLGTKALQTAIAYNNLGGVYYDMERYDEALEHRKESLQIKRDIFGDRHTSTAIAYNNLASVYSRKGDKDEALKHFKQVLSILLENLGEKHVQISRTYNNLGKVYSDMGKYNLAVEHLEKSLEIAREIRYEDTARTREHLNEIYSKIGRSRPGQSAK